MTQKIKPRRSRVARRAAHCTAWWLLSQSAWAAQSNVVSIRHDAEQANASSVAGTKVQRQEQRSLNGAVSAAASAHVVQTEQQNLIDASRPASARTLPSRSTGNDSSAQAAAASDVDGETANATPIPDERPLWRLLHEKRLAAYDRSAAALAQDVPSWKPSPALVAERARLQREADISAALSGEGEPEALRLLIERAPEEFGCAHIDRVWKAADLFARTGRADEIDRLYRVVIPACKPDTNRIATLYRAEQTLSAEQVDALIELEAAQGRRDAEGEAAFERLRYQRAVATLGVEPPESARAAQQLAALAPSIHAYRDGPAATLAGWIALAQHRTDEAGHWFDSALTYTPDSADATLGLAQVRIETHAYESAQTLLERPALRDDPRARKARAQLALAQANAAYGERRYRDSLRWLDQAASDGLPTVDSDVLRGWNLYALGQYAQAAAAFRERYEQSRDDDSAEGLALATRAMNKNGAAPKIAGGAADVSEHDPVAAYVRALDAQQRYYRKQFVESKAAMNEALAGSADRQRIGHYLPADLTGIDAASVAGGLTWSDHVGAPAQGRLNAIAPEVRGEWIHNTTQYELRYRQLFLNAGTTSIDQTVPGFVDGLIQIIQSNVAQTLTENDKKTIRDTVKGMTLGGSARAEELQAMVSDSVRVGTVPKFDWSLSLGATQGAPSGFQPNVLGSIAQRTTWGIWSIYGGMTPVRDSLLSWRGLSPPAQVRGQTWGAVRRAAAGVQARWQVAPRWNVSAATEAQWLTGMNVVGNEGVSADLSGGYDFRLPGFDYFSMGPAFHYLAYRRNENFYSWGQGGYYSPQSSVSTGIALQWLSKEGRRWQFQGNLETGWNNTHEHNEPCFPLSPSLSNLISIGLQSSPSAASAGEFACAGSHDHGLYMHTQISATVKLSERVQAGALADVNVTPGRDKQFAALAFVRYFFEPRAAVFSRDLPRNTRDFYLQLDDNH